MWAHKKERKYNSGTEKNKENTDTVTMLTSPGDYIWVTKVVEFIALKKRASFWAHIKWELNMALFHVSGIAKLHWSSTTAVNGWLRKEMSYQHRKRQRISVPLVLTPSITRLIFYSQQDSKLPYFWHSPVYSLDFPINLRQKY